MLGRPGVCATATAANPIRRIGGEWPPVSQWASRLQVAASVRARATAFCYRGVARNPGARAGILLLLTLGLAFIESLALFTLVIIVVKVK